MKYLQPLDIGVNRAFKVALWAEWEAWMTSGKKSFTKTGHMRRATFAQVCQWVLTAWSSVKTSTVTNGFPKAGLLHDEEDSTSSNSPRDKSDTESNDERETENACDEDILKLFNSRHFFLTFNEIWVVRLIVRCALVRNLQYI